jgi:signal transduction histidine kinase
MSPQAENRPDSPAATQRLARLLRHEVGDLLQSIYSTVGILLERLPEALKLERQLVSDLKGRAELCKIELDAVAELATPPNFTPGPTDLLTPIHSALLLVRRRFPALEVRFDGAGPVRIVSDSRSLCMALNVLFIALCHGAQRLVSLRLQPDQAHIECLLQRDGYNLTPGQLRWLDEPFATTQQALLGIGLALVKRLLTATGGAVFAENLPEGGVRVCVCFPLATDS